MKSIKKVGLFLLVAAIGANLAIERAHADSGNRVAVNIPFDFVVGKSLLKAGSYKVQVLDSRILKFWSADAQQHNLVLMISGSAPASGNGDPYFVFTRYGSETFLSKVAMSVDQSYELPVSGREKEIMHGMSAGGRDSVTIQQGR